MPLLTDWRNEVIRQVDPEAREIALAGELLYRTWKQLREYAAPMTAATQMGYITNAEADRGRLRTGGPLVPFSNTIPKDTELYRLMSTAPSRGEKKE